MMESKITWLVVAQKAEARVYAVDPSKSIQLVQQFNHPEARERDRELGSDRPGRSYSSNSTTRHSYTQEHGPTDQIAINFSKEIGHFLDKARNDQRFGSLMIFAGPRFLGNLRHELSTETCALIISELDKNLGGFTEHEITKYLRAI